MSEPEILTPETRNSESAVAESSPIPEPTPGLLAQTSEKVRDDGWSVITTKSRVDSFNQESLIEEVRSLMKKEAKFIAIDLRATRFLSFHAIRFFVEAAQDLVNQEGQLALVACAEKTKRHFEIYGSLDNIQLVRTESELASLRSK